MTRTRFHRACVATVRGPLVALSNVSVQAKTPETRGQLIAAARLVGVSDSASNKHALGTAAAIGSQISKQTSVSAIMLPLLRQHSLPYEVYDQR